MDCDGAGASSVGLVDLSPELEECLGGGRHPVGRPGAEVELGDGPGLARAGVLQVHGADQVVVAPDVLADQMDLRKMGTRSFSQSANSREKVNSLCAPRKCDIVRSPLRANISGKVGVRCLGVV